MKVPFFRSPYNYDTAAASQEAAELVGDYGPSLTVAEHAIDADINVIMKRFGVTGKMPENVRLPQYGDFTQVGDYRSALEAVRSAQEAFMEIPADIRARFDNDPQNLLTFAADPANVPKLVELGLGKVKEVVNGLGGSTGSTSSGSPARADAQAPAGGGSVNPAPAGGGAAAGAAGSGGQPAS